jgi:hypothetical protein
LFLFSFPQISGNGLAEQRSDIGDAVVAGILGRQKQARSNLIMVRNNKGVLIVPM